MPRPIKFRTNSTDNDSSQESYDRLMKRMAIADRLRDKIEAKIEELKFELSQTVGYRNDVLKVIGSIERKLARFHAQEKEFKPAPQRFIGPEASSYLYKIGYTIPPLRIYTAIRQGWGPAYEKEGNRYVFMREDLEKWAKEYFK